MHDSHVPKAPIRSRKLTEQPRKPLTEIGVKQQAAACGIRGRPAQAI